MNIKLKLLLSLVFSIFFSFASGNDLSAGEFNTTNMTEGVVSYSYDITDGTESVVPRLQATLQFNESADIDEVIFILRSKP